MRYVDQTLAEMLVIYSIKKSLLVLRLGHVRAWSRATPGMLSVIGQNVLGRSHVNKSVNS